MSSKDAAKLLYNKMHEAGGYPYENLELQGTTPTLSTRRGDDGKSTCQIGRHIVRLEELHPEMPVDEFVNVVKTVLRALKDHCPPFFLQRCKVHCLSQPNVTPNPLGILASRIGNVGDKVDPFGRPPTFFGVRFRFQPWSSTDQDNDEEDVENGDSGEDGPSSGTSSMAVDQPPTELPAPPAVEARGHVTVRFEPYDADPSQVWIEVAAMHFAPEPIMIADLSFVEKNILETWQFAADNCKKFLDQFDPQTDITGGQP